jgi:hypothetical protein
MQFSIVPKAITFYTGYGIEICRCGLVQFSAISIDESGGEYDTEYSAD